MLKHHEDSIKNMVEYFKTDARISALFLIGSVATGTARPDSDLDGVAVISQEYFDRRKASHTTMECHWGKCTYENGYFDIHYKTREHIESILKNGSEPMRNMFSCARPLYCDDAELAEMVSRIPVFPEAELAAKKQRYYCTMKQYHNYFWKICKPQGFHRNHVANGMVFCAYRLVLLENKILFPSLRKMEECVINAPNKPEAFIEKCHSFLHHLTDEEAAALVNDYESWTAYDYPKDFSFISNHFADPYEWQ
ncbi:MAG: nucleotidyltransferase domain-containing protein [Defluviitaleaceae bacterium]|nr:nucleotidyltransferase domain-containing protein [Defluviitaleaceae bacterium]